LRGSRYLEVGFGNGASILAAAQLGMECSGFDLDPSNVADVSRRAKALDLDIRVWCGDANQGLEKRETYELIKSSQVIEHLLDPVDFVGSLTRLLSSEGHLYLECPNNSASFLHIKNRLRRPFKRMDFHNSLRINEHLWGFNHFSMIKLLRSHNLDVVFCRDYPVRHRYFQPQNKLWYPHPALSIAQSFSTGDLYPLLKSAISIFDFAASIGCAGGIGLAALAQKRHVAHAETEHNQERQANLAVLGQRAAG
jgi:SAM-dependent methyltransferase